MPVERMSHVYVAFGGICGDNPGAYNGGAGLAAACTDLHAGSDTAAYWIPEITSQADGTVSFMDDPWCYFDHSMTSPITGEEYVQM